MYDATDDHIGDARRLAPDGGHDGCSALILESSNKLHWIILELPSGANGANHSQKLPRDKWRRSRPGWEPNRLRHLHRRRVVKRRAAGTATRLAGQGARRHRSTLYLMNTGREVIHSCACPPSLESRRLDSAELYALKVGRGVPGRMRAK